MKPIKIFKGEYGYSMGISKRKEDNTYENGYFQVQFKKGIEIENGKEIIPTDWKIEFYDKKDGTKGYKLCIWDFTYPIAKETKEKLTDPYESFAKENGLTNDIDESSLPF